MSAHLCCPEIPFAKECDIEEICGLFESANDRIKLQTWNRLGWVELRMIIILQLQSLRCYTVGWFCTSGNLPCPFLPQPNGVAIPSALAYSKWLSNVVVGKKNEGWMLIPSKPSRPSKGDKGGMQLRIPLNPDNIACPNKDLAAAMILQHTSSRYIDSRLLPWRPIFPIGSPWPLNETTGLENQTPQSHWWVIVSITRDQLLNILLNGDDKFLGLCPDKSLESLWRFEAVQSGMLLTLMTIDFVW